MKYVVLQQRTRGQLSGRSRQRVAELKRHQDVVRPYRRRTSDWVKGDHRLAPRPRLLYRQEGHPATTAARPFCAANNELNDSFDPPRAA